MASSSCSQGPISARCLPRSFSSTTRFLLLRSAPTLSLRRLRSPLRPSESQLLSWTPGEGGSSRPGNSSLGWRPGRGRQRRRGWRVRRGRGGSRTKLGSPFQFPSQRFRKDVSADTEGGSVGATAIYSYDVRFAVNGVLILAFLWGFLKHLSSVVFTSVLLIGMTWSFLSYAMDSQHNYARRIDNEDSRWSGAGAA